MIEHSITKYKEPAYIAPANNIIPYTRMPAQSVAANNQPNITHRWDVKQCNDYIEDLKKRGYVVGAQVTTKYGIEGDICGYRNIPPGGLSFFSQRVPDMIQVSRPNFQTMLTYSEFELTSVVPPMES